MWIWVLGGVLNVFFSWSVYVIIDFTETRRCLQIIRLRYIYLLATTNDDDVDKELLENSVYNAACCNKSAMARSTTPRQFDAGDEVFTRWQWQQTVHRRYDLLQEELQDLVSNNRRQPSVEHVPNYRFRDDTDASA